MKNKNREEKSEGFGFSIIIIISIIIFVGVGAFWGKNYFIEKDPSVTNDFAEKNEDKRYLTIINDTQQVINKVYVTVGEGTEIEGMTKENPDEKSFSLEIPNQYKEYDTFTVVLIDRNDIIYKKEISNVKEKGRTEVKVTQDNYKKEKNDVLKKINKFFNGD